MTRPLAFLDIETTGLDPRVHDVLEVAFILRTEGKSMPWKHDYESHQFALPINLRKADSKALEVNRYHERVEFLESIFLLPWDAADLLVEKLDGVMLVGNNIQFDARFLSEFLYRNVRKEAPWYHNYLDLKAWVGGAAGYLTPAKTPEIATLSGVPIPEDAHAAMADAEWNLAVYERIESLMDMREPILVNDGYRT